MSFEFLSSLALTQSILTVKENLAEFAFYLGKKAEHADLLKPHPLSTVLHL